MSPCTPVVLAVLSLVGRVAWSHDKPEYNVTFGEWTKEQVGQEVRRLTQEASELTGQVEKLTTRLDSMYGEPNKANNGWTTDWNRKA
ncbi:hypothetical protein BaRGS_00008987 [Batillaria attramentaria]|uniref:Uncharacterized protein n=1 Tax=Batillaria attramentaria TaxID=370345 RepID=A0ABD0LJE5_9CAEN